MKFLKTILIYQINNFYLVFIEIVPEEEKDKPIAKSLTNLLNFMIKDKEEKNIMSEWKTDKGSRKEKDLYEKQKLEEKISMEIEIWNEKYKSEDDIEFIDEKKNVYRQ